MNTGFKSNLICVGMIALLLTCVFSVTAQAKQVYQTRVKVIHASKGPAHVDPGIQDVVREIKPVFQYSRFKLVNQKSMSLPQGKQGVMSLPGQRQLVITPQGKKGKRIQYHIRINSKGSPIFQTGVRLKNNGSVTIGGPKVKKGVLLINIQGSTR